MNNTRDSIKSFGNNNRKGKSQKSKTFHVQTTLYCMTCCCHGCKADDPHIVRSNKVLKKNKFAYLRGFKLSRYYDYDCDCNCNCN